MRWWILVVPSAIYFFSYFHRVSSAVVARDVMEAFSITAAALGNLSAVYPYVFVAMGLVAGSLADTLGPRWTLALGATSMGFGAAVFGLAPIFGVAYVGRLLVGLGASVVLISFLRLAAEWFRPHEFATVSGWTQVVGNAGGFLAATPLALLVEGIGWRQSFIVIGVATLGLAVAAVLFIRDGPEALGLPPLEPRRQDQRRLELTEVIAGIPAIAANARMWPPVLAAAGIFASLVTFQGLWGVPYLVEAYGLPRVRAANLISLLAAGIILGAPLVGVVSDRWLAARRLPFAAFAAVYAACWAPLVVPEWRLPLAVLPAFLFVMGVASCGMVLLWACLREVSDPARVGVVIGFSNMPIFLALALLQWVTGLVLDARWTGLTAGGIRVYSESAYMAAFGLCSVMALGAAFAAALVTETRCRNVWRPPA